MNRFSAIFSLSLLLVTPACQPRHVVARVNGEAITDTDLAARLYSSGRDPHNQLGAALNSEIENVLLEQAARKAGMDKNALSNRGGAAGERAWLAEAYRERVLRRQQKPGDKEIEAYYLTRFAKLPPTTEYHVSRIVVKTAAEAARISALLRRGSPFSALAKAKSIDRVSAAFGGNLPALFSGALPAPYAGHLETMKPGAISAPIPTPEGYEIFRLDSKITLPQPRLEQMRVALTNQLEEERYNEWIKKARTAAVVEVDEKALDTVPGLVPAQP